MGERPTEMRSDPASQRVNDFPGSSPGEPEQIRAEIAQTRAGMANTVEALQDKLAPERLMNEAKDRLREATVGKVKDMMSSATDTASDLASHVQHSTQDAADYVRENPWPAAAIGAGVVWLLMRNRGSQPRVGTRPRPTGLFAKGPQARRTQSYEPQGGWMAAVRENPVPAALAGLGVSWIVRNYNRSQDVRRAVDATRGAYTAPAVPSSSAVISGSPPGSWSEAAHNTASAAQNAVSETARDARERIGAVTEVVQEGWQQYSRRAESQFDRWMRDNPLTIGAAAVVIGAAVGLSAPRTDSEDAWLGETRDSLVDRAQDAATAVAQTTVQRAEDAVAGAEGAAHES